MKTKLEIKEVNIKRNKLTGNKEGNINVDLIFPDLNGAMNITLYSNDFICDTKWIGSDKLSTKIKVDIEVNKYIPFINILLKIKMIKKNSVFSIKDIFTDREWNRIPISNKRRLGMILKQYVDAGLIPEVKFESVDSNRTRHYKKIK